jgi:hypothetical protein
MARAVHRRPDWAAAVSMASSTITYYETSNGEYLRGWHTGLGMLYVWNRSTGLGQCSDSFWPTVDPYRLPGTTVPKRKLADAHGGGSRPDVRWVGGTTDGAYAAIGQDIRGLGSTLRAKKSWFFLDDCIVCLGSDINSTDGVGVETIVDNHNLGEHGTHILTVDGTVQPATLPWSATLAGVRWAHIAGFHGYIFIDGVILQAIREARTGAWRDINRGGPTDPINRRYLTLYLTHGTVGSDYAYVVLPGATTATVAARAATVGDWLTIHANNKGPAGHLGPRARPDGGQFLVRQRGQAARRHRTGLNPDPRTRHGGHAVCVRPPAHRRSVRRHVGTADRGGDLRGPCDHRAPRGHLTKAPRQPRHDRGDAPLRGETGHALTSEITNTTVPIRAITSVVGGGSVAQISSPIGSRLMKSSPLWPYLS